MTTCFEPRLTSALGQNCGDILTKKKLDPHRNQCYGASFTCIDCMVHFQGTDYRSHTSCISEAQKYQGHLYRGEKKGKGQQQQQQQQQNKQAVVPHKASVEDESNAGATAGSLAVLDVPPKAPSPPPASEVMPARVNVFDFLVAGGTPAAAKPTRPALNGHAHDAPSNGTDQHYASHGYSYGETPLQPSFERYDSYPSLPAPTKTAEESQTYVTPGPKREKGDKQKSDKKRKRNAVEELDMSRVKQVQDELMTDPAAAPILHSGLTGGLNRLLSNPDFSDNDRVAPSPLSPKKRSKKEKSSEGSRKVSSSTTKTSSTRRDHDDNDSDNGRDSHRQHRKHRHHRHRRGSSSDSDHERHSRKHLKAIDYRATSGSVEPRADNQVVTYRSPAELFLSFVNKGPESERGLSINKALKRYHREAEVRGDRDDGDKELFKQLRVRRNERGEFVLFI
ncbi:hypothetical protein MBLNU459_g5768t1 [Dothideomycetes sp. NU459]